jgi:hypothetical protein
VTAVRTTGVPTGGSPLAATVRAAGATPEALRHGTPTDGDWLRCADLLADPAALAGWAERSARWFRSTYGEAPERVVAGHLVGWYLTVPARTGALLFHTARRVPPVGPADLAVRFADGHPRPAEVAVLADSFTCLPGDPAAGLPGVTVAADEPALAAALRDSYTAHAVAFLRAVGDLATPALGRLRLGRRTLWATATDVLDGACWRVGQALDDEAAGAANAALLLPAAVPPLTSASTLRPDPVGGGWTRRRDSCCFQYVLRSGMGTCATCPRVSDR